MSVRRGRVLSAEALTGAGAPAAASAPRARAGGPRVLARATLEAELAAARRLQAAEAEAEAIVRAARAAAAELAAELAQEAQQQAATAVAAQALALAAREQRADELQLERSLELAVLLAERLLGAALELRPSLVASLARQALGEVRGARRLRVVAHPQDLAALEVELASLAFPAEALELRADASRARGALRLETDAGVLDGELAPRLERLAARLREQLGAAVTGARRC